MFPTMLKFVIKSSSSSLDISMSKCDMSILLMELDPTWFGYVANDGETGNHGYWSKVAPKKY